MRRPRCNNCGRKLFLINRIFVRKLPDHCPSCGAELSVERKNKIQKYEGLLYIIACVVFLVVIIVVINSYMIAAN